MFSRECDKKVTDGNQVLFELRELVNKSGVDILQDVRFVNILGVVDINVVRLSLGLPSPEQEKELQDGAGHRSRCFACFCSCRARGQHLQRQLVRASPQARQVIE